MSAEISPALFWQRLRSLHDDIKSGGKKWLGPVKSEADEEPISALALAFGSADDDNAQDFSRSAAVALALYGYEIPKSIHLLAGNKFLVVTSKKAAGILQPLADWAGDKGGLELRVIAKNPADRNAEALAALHQAVQGRRLGVVPKDHPQGDDLVEKFLAPLPAGNVVNVSAGLSAWLSVKDEEGVKSTAQAAVLSTAVLRDHLVNRIIDVINDEQTITHQALSAAADEVLSRPNASADLKLPNKERFNERTCEPCYSPIVQSGGVFDLRPTAQSSDAALAHSGTIVVQLGGRYKGFCSNIGRTLFVNATEHQQAVYEFATELYKACLGVLRPGRRVGEVFLAAKQLCLKNRPDLAPKLVDHVGYGLGLQFVDTDLFLKDPEAERIKGRSQRKIEAGMIFYLCIALDKLRADLPVQDQQERPFDPKLNYSILLGDTIRVTEDDPESLTKFGRKWDRVAYNLGDSDEEEEDEEEESSGDEAAGSGKRGVDRNALRAESAEQQESAIRDKHQSELAARKRDEALQRLAAGSVDDAFDTERKWDEKFHSYRSLEDYPPEAFPSEIYVDSRAETVLLPIGDALVPFHIGTIKNVYKRVEGPWTTLVLHFLTPQEAGKERAPMWADQRAKYVRELSYRSKSQSLDAAFRMIKALKKRVADRRKEQEARASLVKQKALVLGKGEPVAKLRDVAMRPHISRKKATGILYAYQNGFRYKSSTKQHVDIIYENIKNAFFKPAQNSISVLLHFELKNGIILSDKSKKKTNYVQFFVDVIDASQDIDPRSRYRDEDGLQEEQEERRNTDRWNDRFKKFVKTVEEHTAASKGEEPLEFDIPYPELAFTGVPGKQRVDVMPSVNCLVALEDVPPLVIATSEVDICSLERVDFHLREFDMVFVMKDLKSKTPFVAVNSVPMKKLEEIKNWLDQSDIKYYESPKNLIWKDALKDVVADLEGFYRSGGWDSEEWFGGNGGDEGDEGEAVCDECEKESASFQCSQCEKLFCIECNQTVHNNRAMRKHRRLQIVAESESDFEPDSGSGSDSAEFETSSDEDDSEAYEDDLGSELDEDEEELSEDALEWDEMDRRAAESDRAAERRDQNRDAKARGRPGYDSEDEEEDRPRKKQKQAAGKSSSSSSSKSSKAPPKRK